MSAKGIDWKQVHRRLEESRHALESVLTGSPEHIRAVYRERARKLAGSSSSTGSMSDGVPVLVFRVGGESYAIEAAAVAEVCPPAGYTAVPGSDALFLGIRNLRGVIRTEVDLGELMGHSALPDPAAGFTILLRRPGYQIGLRVERVEHIEFISSEDFADGQEDGQFAHGQYLKRITSGMIGIVDVDAIWRTVTEAEAAAL